MEHVSAVMTRLMGELGLTEAVQGWRAVDEWPTLVGPRIAQHSRAVAFRDGTLHVEVEGSAWMQELGYLRRDLARRINQTLGADMVREVRLRVPRGGSLR